MAGTYLGLPFDEELWFQSWQQAPDTYKASMIASGALVADGAIAERIAGGSAVYDVPFYNVLANTEPTNYDGKTDIADEEHTGDDLKGVVFGRAKGWTARDFTKDFNGAYVMDNIIAQVSKYWDKQSEKTLLAVLSGVFGCTPTDGDVATAWALHTTDISAASGTVTADNKLAAAAIADAAVKACGDNAAGMFGLAIMHSAVANNLAKLNLLEYRKYTDPMGIERQLPIADINGYTVITDDALVDTTGSAPKYTTYLLGEGAIRYADGPVSVPVEVHRDPAKNGGQDTLYTRIRKTFLVNGVSWIGTSNVSPTLAELGASANYDVKFDPKGIGVARVVSNG